MNLAIPSVILIFLSDDGWLGPVWGLVLALAFPLAWGVGTAVTAGGVSGLAAIAFASILLTGGVGLLELDPGWIALKEGGIPLLIGLATLASARTRYALVPVLLGRLLDRERMARALDVRGTAAEWATAQVRATVSFGIVFLGSAVLTFALARFIVVSPAGSAEFNEELGWFTMLSLPVVGIPVLGSMAWILNQLLDVLEELTGFAPADLLVGAEPAE